jgi:signal transduction histidine kinase/CheY-like chemotaxis protein
VNSEGKSDRALLLAPIGRDALVAASILAEAGIQSKAHQSINNLVKDFSEGVGFVVATEEAFATADLSALVEWLGAQEEWSDLPFILLTHRGGGLERNPAAVRHLDLLGNVTFLERPFHPTTLVSLGRSALRGRLRQYEARSRLKDLRDSAERYHSLFESIDAGFCIIDVLFDSTGKPCDYRFVEVNPAFLGHTGLADPVGRLISELVPGHDQHWFDIYGRIALTGEPARFEDNAAAMGRWFDVYAFRVGDVHERRVAVLFNDISGRRAIEQELRDLTASLEERVKTATAEREQALAQLHEAQKLETLGQLTGGVAHDFNNLLTPIMGVLDLMNRRYGADDARAARLIGGALESADRARLLVQRLLGFARRQALQTKPVDLLALLEGMRDLIASSIGPGIQLTVEAEAGLPAALVDPNQLELAILNLAVNARDAMPAGGTLHLSLALGFGKAPVPSGSGEGYLLLSVADSGEGMDAQTLARAIEPFYSTKGIGKGTGLGLSMVHGLTSQLGGGFQLTSAPNEGTQVKMWLPIAAEEAVGFRSSDVEELREPSQAVSILLVDDEQLVRSATAEMLRELGHTVAEAGSGQDALAKLKDMIPDLIITDYKMPHMDGTQLAEQVRRIRPEMPILLITGYSGPSADTQHMARLDKPFRRADLSSAIDNALRARVDVLSAG